MKTLKTKTVALASVLLGLTLSAGSQNNPLSHHVNDRYVIAHIKWSASPRVATEEEPLKMVLGVFDPGSTGTVVSAWIRHYGLIDPNEFDNANFGAAMSKNTVSSTNSAAVGQVRHTNCTSNCGDLDITDLTMLGYDIRNGSHCGAGSPRFDVIDSTGTDHFVGGCSNGTITPAPGAPGWNRVRFDPTNPAQSFPVLPPGSVVENIFVVVDEGTDVGPDFSGNEDLDNFDVETVSGFTFLGEPT